MKTLKLASLAAFALPLFASIGAPAQAGTHEFLPAVGCVGTTTEGEVAGTVSFTARGASFKGSRFSVTVPVLDAPKTSFTT